MKNFDTLGVMVDCSRNAVKKPDRLHDWIDIISKMGYNALMLYTEDTFEVDGEPYFGYLRGRYTKDELRALDAYAASRGVEMIPCIQTLAHLNAIFRWEDYRGIKDWDDILLAGEERTYELIEHMIKSIRDCFSSKRINIGMDEAYMIGLGHYREKNGSEDRFLIMHRHLTRVCSILEKYGFEPMIWNDMFYKLSKTSGLSANEIKDMIPEKVSLIYWDYYRTNEEEYIHRICENQEISQRIMFAGGAWCWHGFAPFNEFSIKATRSAIRACVKCGIRDVFMTLWGDDGAECSVFSVLPVLAWAAALAEDQDADEFDVRRIFESSCGESYDDFLLLDLPNKVGKKHNQWDNPSKYMLFSDPFLGHLDYTVDEKDGEKYLSYARELQEAAQRSKKYSVLFETLSALCEVLAVKYNLGVATRDAYQSGDKAKALLIAENDYPKCIRLLESFALVFDRQWDSENKPNGMDVQDLRIGGIKERLRKCGNRLRRWAVGDIDQLPELAQTILPVSRGKEKGETVINNTWSYISSVNVISHNCK